ncbi:hypothetical protein [Siphonobacter sp. BAB-5385]|uniref:alpha-glucuronidase family glycosyl hydrolase n=1 Tax=Siphonobacter sp. BAB-5385 TaxID=1864822 RepID=UPI0026909B59
MNIRILIAIGVLWLSAAHAQQIVSTKPTPFAITQSVIYVDANETELLQTSAQLLQKDIELVTGRQLPIVHTLDKVKQNVIAIGTPGQSAWIKQLVAGKKLNPSKLQRAWETYHLQTLQKPMPAIAQALVISGSDRRGVAYGVFELSRQLGVSPWHWWADVPVKNKAKSTCLTM